MKPYKPVFVLLVLVLASAVATPVALAQTSDRTMQLFQERTYQGKSIVFWLHVLRDRDEELMPKAFDAIRSLQDDAWVAIPDLTKVIEGPFVAININDDSHDVIASKLYDVALRAQAMEMLTSMGEAGAPATRAVVGWALAERVVPMAGADRQHQELFIELVAMDAEQRVHSAEALAAFGADAFPTVAKLITSPDNARRRLAVAVLGQEALPIAAELLRSRDCGDREIGLLVLKDMSLVVPEAYVDELAAEIRENCTMLSEVQRRLAARPVSSIK